jgi:hypothetical protein
LETWNGTRYDVIELTDPSPVTQRARLYIGRDKLIHRTTFVMSRKGEPVSHVEYVFPSLEINKPLPPATFVFIPPQDSTVADTRAMDVQLIPVGKEAPNFTLPTPAGGQVALGELLRGKKALLINFWFYG